MSYPTTTIYKYKIKVLYSTGSTLNNLASNVTLSSSVIPTENTGYYKAVLFKVSSGSATSLGASGSLFYIDYSCDNTAWHGADNTGLSGFTGSLTTLNQWYYFELAKVVPYIRVLLINKSGSALSGSIFVYGFEN